MKTIYIFIIFVLINNNFSLYAENTDELKEDFKIRIENLLKNKTQSNILQLFKKDNSQNKSENSFFNEAQIYFWMNTKIKSFNFTDYDKDLTDSPIIYDNKIIYANIPLIGNISIEIASEEGMSENEKINISNVVFPFGFSEDKYYFPTYYETPINYTGVEPELYNLILTNSSNAKFICKVIYSISGQDVLKTIKNSESSTYSILAQSVKSIEIDKVIDEGKIELELFLKDKKIFAENITQKGLKVFKIFEEK